MVSVDLQSSKMIPHNDYRTMTDEELVDGVRLGDTGRWSI